MSTVGERVRAIRIGLPSAQAAINKPLCAHDRSVLSSIVRGVVRRKADRWLSSSSRQQGISPASITRLTQRGYITVDAKDDAPCLLPTEAGRLALRKP